MGTLKLEIDMRLKVKAVSSDAETTLNIEPSQNFGGSGEFQSPTEMLASSLGACTLIMMGHKSNELGLKMKFSSTVRYKMKNARIEGYELNIMCEGEGKDEGGDKGKEEISHRNIQLIEAAALRCPIHHALNPNIDVKYNFNWTSQ